jgi:hypothetical protein
MPPAINRPQKITLAEMRSSGVRGLLIYCADYRCSHSIAISGDRWPDGVRLSDIEERSLSCSFCRADAADIEAMPPRRLQSSFSSSSSLS